MPGVTLPPQPRLYLDVDGVLLADESPFATEELYNERDVYPPEVARRLGSTGLDLVWLTTREDDALNIGERIGLPNGRLLPRRGQAITEGLEGTDEDGKPVAWKASALIKDQLASPTPFVWVDDHITPLVRRFVFEKLAATPKLLIIPDTSVGLVGSSLRSIEDFAQTHQPQA